jgi:tetratricopeptide (TPR) repeat protein
VTRALAIAAVLLAARGAHADDIEVAKQHYAASKQHFDLGEWDQAIAELREAHRLHPDPAYLFNLAQAYRLKGDCLEAYDQYKAFLRETAEPSQQTEYADGFVKELEPCASRRRAELQAAQRIAAMPVPVERTRPGLRTAGYVSIGLAVVAGAASAYWFVQANHDSVTVAKALAEHPVMWTDALEQTEQQGKRDNALGIGAAIAGGALAVAGGALWYLGRTRIETIVVEPSATGATVGASWQF